jgi:UDP-N-acetylglucosamine--N-acetylmuramyl-(pentapeptide) pyrophosphoryl-undecaprenol N-acetylglucosamine transferase
MKIVLAGGQTGGPVVPLLAVAEEIKRQKSHTQVLVLDTPNSAARILAAKQKFHFYAIHTGKLRRYWSIRTLLAPLAIAWGFLQALRILHSFKPNIVMGAGGFVQVPVVWAAWILNIPVLLHQQDVASTLSNSLSAPFARRITTTFEQSRGNFHSGSGFFGSHKRNKNPRVVWTGNPFRESILEATKDEARKHFKLDDELPVLLVTGGGGGAQGINNLLYKALPDLTKAVQIIHGTGVGKKYSIAYDNYHAYEFIDRMDLAYAASDLVISRAGISTITELANLGKISIIIPIPRTHQEINAQLLYQMQAAIILDQNQTNSEFLVSLIRKLLLDGDTQKLLHHNISKLMPKKAAAKIAKLALELATHAE